jgi:oxysterol-binding protein 1
VLASQLNELEEGIAPTDSRLRPDQRLMEFGLWDEANIEKLRLEEIQRVRNRKVNTGLADSNQTNENGTIFNYYNEYYLKIFLKH